MKKYDDKTFKLDKNIIYAGVDEVGRGCLFGPVVAAAVIFKPGVDIAEIKDSKKLTVLQREKIYDKIINNSQAYALGRAEAWEIDKINILQASLLAMKRAIMSLTTTPEHLLIDGSFVPKINLPATAIIDGDNLIAQISAASIIAKVSRDREMLIECNNWPEYGLAKHKGYATKTHLAALKKYGATPGHRKSFKPVQNCLVENSLR